MDKQRHRTSIMVWNEDGIGCCEMWDISPISALERVWENMDGNDYITDENEPSIVYHENTISKGRWYVYLD